MTSETVKVIVARGRSIQGPDGRIYGPGEEVAIPAEDEQHIRANGFVHDPSAFIPERTAPTPHAEENPSRIGLQRVIER